MNGPSSDENEMVPEIIVVCTDEPVALLLKGHLEERDHRVFVCTDTAGLKDSLPKKRPGLLIVDVSTRDQENFEFIGGIKADEELRKIPVLLLTTASTMEDLLKVLECEADNFITPPYNHPDHLSLIESMLVTPIEDQIADRNEKQFRIRHDDQIFVVTGNSKKLLEYLLSSFDTLVTKSSDMSQLTIKLQELSDRVQEMELTISGQTHVIETVNENAREKEQNITGLVKQCCELEKSLKQKTDEIADLKIKYDNTTSLIANRDESILAMTRDREETFLKHHSQIDELNNRISTLAAESDSCRIHLDTIQQALKEETTRNVDLETSLRNLTRDYDMQKSAFEAEKNRTMALELEMKAAVQARTQSEQNLNSIITGLNETAKQQAAVISRLKEELEKETGLRVMMENQLDSARKEAKQAEISHKAELDKLSEHFSKLQNALASSAADFESGQELRRGLEEKTRAAIHSREDLEKRLGDAQNEIDRIKNSQAGIVTQYTEELKDARHQIQSLQTDINRLTNEKLQAGQQIRKLASETGHPGSEPTQETAGGAGIEETDPGVESPRHLVQQSLFQSGAVDAPKEDVQLVVSEGAQFPVHVQQASRQITPVSDETHVPGKSVSREPAGEMKPVVPGIVPEVVGISNADSIFTLNDPGLKKAEPGPGPLDITEPGREKSIEETLSDGQPDDDKMSGKPPFNESPGPENKINEGHKESGNGTGSDGQSGLTNQESRGPVTEKDLSFGRDQWLDLIRWAHNSGALSPEQRQKIIRMGRLIQKDRKLTNKQQDQVREMLASAYALGYQAR